MKKKKKKLSIIYGSDSGSTEKIAFMIAKKMGIKDKLVVNVANATEKNFIDYKTLILAVSTWYIGDLQNDWDDFFDKFEKINFKGIKVGLVGLGDQHGYAYNFVDGIGILAEVIIKNGGEIIGYWPTKGYNFEESLGIAKNSLFYGLAIDEDNQADLTEDRVSEWVLKIKKEINF